MAKQWWRIDKRDGLVEPCSLEHIKRVIADYHKDVDLAMAAGTFQTSFATYEFKDVPEATTTAF